MSEEWTPKLPNRRRGGDLSCPAMPSKGMSSARKSRAASHRHQGETFVFEEQRQLRSCRRPLCSIPSRTLLVFRDALAGILRARKAPDRIVGKWLANSVFSNIEEG